MLPLTGSAVQSADVKFPKRHNSLLLTAMTPAMVSNQRVRLHHSGVLRYWDGSGSPQDGKTIYEMQSVNMEPTDSFKHYRLRMYTVELCYWAVFCTHVHYKCVFPRGVSCLNIIGRQETHCWPWCGRHCCGPLHPHTSTVRHFHWQPWMCMCRTHLCRQCPLAANTRLSVGLFSSLCDPERSAWASIL